MSHTNLAELVVTTWRELFDRGWVEQERLLEHIVNFLHFHRKEMPEVLRTQLETLREDVVGKGFSSNFRRYVGMDLLVDKYDQDGKVTNANVTKIKELAQTCFEKPDLLRAEFSWLVTDKASNGYLFGYELSKVDTNLTLLSDLLAAQAQPLERRTGFFLGGYLRAIFERNVERWEVELDRIKNDSVLRKFIAELTWRSGVSDRAMMRILDLARSGEIPLLQLRHFSYGGALQHVSEPVLEEMVTFCCSKTTTRE